MKGSPPGLTKWCSPLGVLVHVVHPADLDPLTPSCSASVIIINGMPEGISMIVLVWPLRGVAFMKVHVAGYACVNNYKSCERKQYCNVYRGTTKSAEGRISLYLL